jgi:hypothetical protein
MGVLFNRNCNSNEEINNRVKKCGNIIRSLNSILQDKSLRKITKERIDKTVVRSVMKHGWGKRGMKVGRRGTKYWQPKWITYEGAEGEREWAEYGMRQ